MHASCPVNSTHQLETGDQEVLMKNEQQSSSTTTTTSSTISDDHAAASPSTGSSTPDSKPSPADQAPAARRKRALLCGVTYGMEENRPCLSGPINDVNGIKNMLIQPPFEFPAKDIRVLMEENGNHHDLTPTKKNIEDSLKWLVEGSESGDSLVFYFSGHGGRNSENNKLDHGFTESYICPADFKDRGDVIRNNDINSTIVRPLKEGVTLHAIVDACYSGNLLDLKYKYDLQTCMHACSSDINQAAGTWIDKKPAEQSEADKLGTSGGLAICLSACEDDRTAPETNAFSPNTIMGAMTHHLIEIVRSKKNHDRPEIPDVTYKDILQQLLKLHVTYNIKSASAPLAMKSTSGLHGSFSKEVQESKRIEKPVLSSSSSLEPGGVLSKKFLL